LRLLAKLDLNQWLAGQVVNLENGSADQQPTPLQVTAVAGFAA
jgi:hypothetical protein